MTNPDSSDNIMYKDINDGFALAAFFEHAPHESIVLPANAQAAIAHYPALTAIADAVRAQIDNFKYLYPDRLDSIELPPYYIQSLGRLATTPLRELMADGAAHALTALQDCATFFTNDLVLDLRQENLPGLDSNDISTIKIEADSRTIPQMAVVTLAALRDERTGLAENSALRVPERFAAAHQQLIGGPMLNTEIVKKVGEIPLHAEAADEAFIEGAIAGLAILAATAEGLQTHA